MADSASEFPQGSPWLTEAYRRAFTLLQENPRIAPLWHRAKDACKRPSVLKAHELYQRGRQRRAFAELVRGMGRGVPYSEAETRARLQAKKDARQPLCDAAGRAHVVAFGLEDWERHGFWQSWERQCNFRFVNIRELAHSRGVYTYGDSARAKTASAVLDTIDTLARTQPVSLAFFYIDSESLCPELFAGLRQRGVWSVVMGLDDKHRYFLRREHGMVVGQAALVPHVDVMWTSWRAGAQIMQDTGGAAWFAPQGADPSFHRYIECERDIDVLFLGQNYGQRGALVRGLRRRGIDVYTAGRGWPHGFVSFEESVELFNRAKVVLGYSATGQMKDVACLKGRDFEAPMCGALYATSYNPELADCYHVGREVLCYSSVADCAELLRGVLLDGKRQARIRKAGRARALREHTWESRVRDLLALFPQA